MESPAKATEIKAAIAAVVAFLTALWGWTGWAIFIWLACIFLDYVAGSLAAKKDNNWSSAIAREGCWHKLGEIFAVMVAALCDIALNVIMKGVGIEIPIEVGPLVTPIVLLWYILTELGSIIENCGKLGAPVPKWFSDYVEKQKDKIDKQNEIEE
jgi:toxin secretion/phage lysis holin